MYGSGFICILNYGLFSGGVAGNEDFLLMDTTDFLLMDGSNFLLMD